MKALPNAQFKPLVESDDVLRLRKEIQPYLDRKYPTLYFLKLFRHALEHGSWYCATYLRSITALEVCSIDQQADLLLAASVSKEPQMLQIAYCDREAMLWQSPTTKPLLLHLASERNHSMLGALQKLAAIGFQDFERMLNCNRSLFNNSATLQVLMASPDENIDQLCDATLQRRRRTLDSKWTFINAIMSNDWMLVEFMVKYYHETCLDILRRGSNVRLLKEFLHTAVRHNATQTLRVLLEWIDLETRDESGYTLLLEASRSGCLSMIELLVEGGANPWATTPFGSLAVECALYSRNRNLKGIELLTKYLSEDDIVDIGLKYWPQLDNDTLEELLFNGPKQLIN